MKKWKISEMNDIPIAIRDIDDSDNKNLLCGCDNKPKFIIVVLGNENMVVDCGDTDIICWCGKCKRFN